MINIKDGKIRFVCLCIYFRYCKERQQRNQRLIDRSGTVDLTTPIPTTTDDEILEGAVGCNAEALENENVDMEDHILIKKTDGYHSKVFFYKKRRNQFHYGSI